MLSPDQIQQLKAGMNIPSGNSSGDLGSPATMDWVDSLSKGTPQPGNSQVSDSKQEPGFFQRTAKDLSGRAQNITEDVKSAAADVANNAGDSSAGGMARRVEKLVETGLRTAGEVAGGAGDIAAEGIKSVTPQPVQDLIMKGVHAITGSAPAQKVISGISDWTQKHPEASKDLSSILNIASLGAGGEAEKGATSMLEKAAPKIEDLAGKAADTGTEFVNSAKASIEKRAEDKAMQEALDITKPVLNKKEAISTFENAGNPGGAVEKGMFNKFGVEPNQRSIDIANSVKGIVTKSNGPIDNIVSINKEIGRISEGEIKPFLEKNPAAFNMKTLNAYIRDHSEIPNFIKADPVLQKTYDLARQSMIDEAAKSKGTMSGLWDARKSFDRVAERQLGSLDPMSEKASAIKQAVLDTRRAVNDFIAENTPGGDVNFKGKMKTLSDMYEARGNIAEQNYKLLDKNALQRWIKQNPAKWRMVRNAGLYVGLPALGFEILK